MAIDKEFRQQYLAATRRAKALRASTPDATSAYYDRKSKNIIVKLSTGIGIFFSPQDAQGLERGTASQLSDIEITPSGFGLLFPQLDADFYVPSLLEGILGSRKWMAARLGAQGCKARTKAKASAARANGRSVADPARRPSTIRIRVSSPPKPLKSATNSRNPTTQTTYPAKIFPAKVAV